MVGDLTARVLFLKQRGVVDKAGRLPDGRRPSTQEVFSLSRDEGFAGGFAGQGISSRSGRAASSSTEIIKDDGNTTVIKSVAQPINTFVKKTNGAPILYDPKGLYTSLDNIEKTSDGIKVTENLNGGVQTVDIKDPVVTRTQTTKEEKKNPVPFSGEFFKESAIVAKDQAASVVRGFKKSTNKESMFSSSGSFEKDLGASINFNKQFKDDQDVKAAKRTAGFVVAAGIAPAIVTAVPVVAPVLNTLGKVALAKVSYDFVKEPTPERFVEGAKVATFVLGPKAFNYIKNKLTTTSIETTSAGKVTRVAKQSQSVDVAISKTNAKVTRKLLGVKVGTKNIEVNAVGTSSTIGKDSQFSRKSKSAFQVLVDGKQRMTAGSQEVSTGSRPSSTKSIESGFRKTEILTGKKTILINERVGGFTNVVVDAPGSRVIDSVSVASKTKGAGISITKDGSIVATRAAQSLEIGDGSLVRQQYDFVSKGFGQSMVDSIGANFKASSAASTGTSLSTNLLSSSSTQSSGLVLSQQLQTSKTLVSLVPPDVSKPSVSRLFVPSKEDTQITHTRTTQKVNVVQAKPKLRFTPSSKSSGFSTPIPAEKTQQLPKTASISKAIGQSRSKSSSASQSIERSAVASVARAAQASATKAATKGAQRIAQQLNQRSVSRLVNISGFGGTSPKFNIIDTPPLIPFFSRRKFTRARNQNTNNNIFSRSTKYQPSLVGLDTGIKRKKKEYLTGFEVRGI